MPGELIGGSPEDEWALTVTPGSLRRKAAPRQCSRSSLGSARAAPNAVPATSPARWSLPDGIRTSPRAARRAMSRVADAAALARLIRRFGIDIVHARSRAPAWSAWSAASATGRHFVTTFHNAYGSGGALKRWYNSVMARGERVIAISQFVADHAAQAYGIGPDRLRTIPRGVDFDIFDPDRVGAQRMVSLARQWRLPDGAPVVMLPARLTRWKGGLDLISAIAALGRHDVCCLFVGPEQRRGFRRELEAAIERSGLTGLFRIVE